MQGRLLIVLGLVVCLFAGCCQEPQGQQARVAVSTSYLAVVVMDVLEEDVEVVCLSGPGTCPGHFDVTPTHVARLRRCRLLMRFDFQQYLDAKLQGAVDDGLTIAVVPETGGLCEPDTYRVACAVTADALVREGFLSEAAAEARLRQIDARLADLADAVRAEVQGAGLKGKRVVAAHHQARFCRWLGLDVIAEFTASDDPAELNGVVARSRQNGVRLIVGNVPQGRVIPNRLAATLDAPVAMFANFPSVGDGRGGFDALVRRNVASLLAAREGL